MTRTGLFCNSVLELEHLRFQRKLQDDLDEVNNKWRSVKENFEKFEDDTKAKMEDEKRKVTVSLTHYTAIDLRLRLSLQGK